jgi:CRISPR system Cascade subunit CasC
MTTRTILDIHILQTLPPSNVNRDDTGSPKTATFGGTQRARVSSQAWKRATRRDFDGLLDARDLGVRSKRIVELVADQITALAPDLAGTATELATGIVASTGIKVTETKRKKSNGDEETHSEAGYLVFLSRLQIDQLAREAVRIGRGTDPAAALKAFKGKGLLNRDHSIDLALFGRMVADVSDLNVDASAQVAHAISVHQVSNEADYFTAVDDAKAQAADEDAGAGMIGTVEFNSATYYRYATVDVDRLADSLGSVEAARRAVEAFVRAFATSMPTGKQNTFANRTLPDAVLVQVRESQPVNLVGAFEVAVVAEGGRSRVEIAAERLGAQAAVATEVWGEKPVAVWSVAGGVARVGLDASGLDSQQATFAELPGAIGELVAGRLGENR